MGHRLNIREQARSIFTDALREIDAGAAVRRAVQLSGPSRLIVVDEVYELTEERPRIYAVALGKAAYPMALALDEALGGRLAGGVISGVLPPPPLKNIFKTDNSAANENKPLSSAWRAFAGGHPLPNEASLEAARHCFNLLGAAAEDDSGRHALVIFLISGGGSAMLEAPADDSITLADLQEANRILISCGASIAEVNAVRRGFSRVKGGGLAALAPRATQISLIVSDTEPGDEASVASGPTIEGAPAAADPAHIRSIIKRYDLAARLPASVLKVLLHRPLEKTKLKSENLRRGGRRRHRHVLLDNESALAAAAASAKAAGLAVEIARNLSQQPVENGCAELFLRMEKYRREISENKLACLISGGEFSCPVRGPGTGGRNSEAALRMALLLGDAGREGGGGSKATSTRTAFLSAGTDGIDGNSPAAGAVSDNTTLGRAGAVGLDAQACLDKSDAYTFFQALGDTVMTGPTGTNVRDLRIMIARK